MSSGADDGTTFWLLVGAGLGYLAALLVAIVLLVIGMRRRGEL